MPKDGVSLVAFIALVSFVIERIVTGIVFVLPTLRILPDPQEVEPSQRAAVERRYAYVRFVLGGVLVAAALATVQDVRLLKQFDTLFKSDLGGPLDFFATWVILMSGADRIAAIIKVPGHTPPPTAKADPIQVTGTLSLSDTRRP